MTDQKTHDASSASLLTDGLGVKNRYVLVRDMNYVGEVLHGKWNGEFYVLDDGDCYSGLQLSVLYNAEFSHTPNAGVTGA